MNIKKWSVDGQKTWRIQLHRGHLIHIPSGKRLHNYGKSPFLMGKSTISMAIFNSYVSHYQRVIHINGDSTTQTYGLNQLAAMGDCIQGKRFAEIHSPSIFPNRNLFFWAKPLNFNEERRQMVSWKERTARQKGPKKGVFENRK
jgi:hypothetical protein